MDFNLDKNSTIIMMLMNPHEEIKMHFNGDQWNWLRNPNRLQLNYIKQYEQKKKRLICGKF